MTNGIPILDPSKVIDQIPSEEELKQAQMIFRTLINGHQVPGIARILKHIGEVFVAYAEQEDRVIKEAHNAKIEAEERHRQQGRDTIRAAVRKSMN